MRRGASLWRVQASSVTLNEPFKRSGPSRMDLTSVPTGLEDWMRWMVLGGIALSASIPGAAVLCRTMMSHTASASAGEPESFGSTAVADDNIGSRSPVTSSDDVRAAGEDIASKASEVNRQALSEGLDEALRARQAAKTQGRWAESEPLPELPQGPQGGTEVEDLAQKMAPELAREAMDLSPRNQQTFEVEHELLQTWKEQKDTLAGKRDTIDTVLHEAQ
jgi:hypothetical protein